MATKISQKEYLKKYLSSDKKTEKKKKKRKAKSSTEGSNVRIIDDDVDISKLKSICDEDLEVYAIGEDAPQIVGVFDERPPELIAKEDYKNSEKWKVLAAVDGSLTVNSFGRDGKLKSCTDNSTVKNRKFTKYDSDDMSPVRKRDTSDLSPVRLSKKERISRWKDADHEEPSRTSRGESRKHSPAQQSKGNPYSSRKERSPDVSPPRRKTSPRNFSESHHSSTSRKYGDSTRTSRRSKSSDQSPPRYGDRNRRTSPSVSPSRKKSTADLPRRCSPDTYVPNRKDDTDQSPPRRRMQNSIESPPGKMNTDSSLPQRRRSSDLSPPRYNDSTDQSPPRRHRTDTASSLGRSTGVLQRNLEHSAKNRIKVETNATSTKLSRWSRDRSKSPTDSSKAKMSKTLDGKSAGLQDAKSLRNESNKFRKREEEIFSNMSAELSGRNAEAVVRDRKTGRVRDIEMEAGKEREKIRKEQERKSVYDRWGKGVKQVEDYQARLQEDLHEISKPVARYADDKDLDALLKQQERDGDPMLNYIRSKEQTKVAGKPSKPIYQGIYPENRFGIRPGYRWDGVDRSNGYEVKWFEVQSKKKAGEEEAYKYSTEDM